MGDSLSHLDDLLLWMLSFNSCWCVCVCFFQGKLPVRWMALESLEDYSYTSESDV